MKSNSNSNANSIIAYATPNLSDLVMVERENIPHADGPAMDHSIDCLMACRSAGFTGFTIDCQKLQDGTPLTAIIYDPLTPEGIILYALQQTALRGITPPPPDIVMAAIRNVEV